MQSKLMYIERKTRDGVNLHHRGPAIIGEVTFSKSGKSIYYKGMAFRRAEGIYGNYIQFDPTKENNLLTEEQYQNQLFEIKDEFWISGIKKRGSNRQKGYENIPIIENGDL